LGEGEEVAVVEEIFAGIAKAAAADILFFHSVGADGGPHGAVNNGDATLEENL
jgi:hypothetical protein